MQISSVADEQLLEEDKNWLETDLSNLGSYEPYDWKPGELNEGLPVKHLPGKLVGWVEQSEAQHNLEG